MALQKDIIASRFGGVTIPGAYLKLVQLFWSDKSNGMVASFAVYPNEAARAADQEVIEVIEVSVPELLPNLELQTYNLCKMKPEMDGATDV